MNRKAKALPLICVGTAALALLVTVSNPHAEKEYAPALAVRPVSAFNQEDRVIPPPSPSPTPVGDKTANAELHSTPPAGIDSKPPKPSDCPAILTSKEQSRGKPTPESSPSQITASVTATEPQMGDTRIVEGEKQVYFLGFGWIEDSDEPNVCIEVDGEGDISQ